MTIEVVASSPAVVALRLDVLDLEAEEEEEPASAVLQQDATHASFPLSPPAAPRLPHITRFSFDPLYA